MPNDPNLATAHLEVITKMFSQAEWLKYSEAIDQVQLYFGEHGVKFGEKKARLFIEYYRNKGYLVHDENQKGYAKWRSGLVQTQAIKPNEDF
jgi:hypothetical protein